MSQRFEVDISAYVSLDNHCRLLMRTRGAKLIYLMWQSGKLTNVQIAEKFGLTYSAVSRRVGLFKNMLHNNKILQIRFNRVKSIIDGLLPESLFSESKLRMNATYFPNAA
jgi:hypothetical protein